MNDTLSLIGFFLNLVGLLGSFFAVHLGNWYRELVQLDAKWQKNKVGSASERKEARLECLYAIKGLHNREMLASSLVISAFLGVVAVLGVILLVPLLGAALAPWLVLVMMLTFLVLYGGLTGYYLRSGRKLGSRLTGEIDAQIALDAA